MPRALLVLAVLATRGVSGAFNQTAANAIDGWFDAERSVDVLLRGLKDLSIHGALVEVGVYHGKSFVHMAKHLEPGVLEPGVALDAFSRQEESHDHTYNHRSRAGLPARDLVMQNVVAHVPPALLPLISVQQASSLEMTAEDVLNRTYLRPVAFFSVDACHTFHCTLNDLELARRVSPHHHGNQLRIIHHDDELIHTVRVGMASPHCQ